MHFDWFIDTYHLLEGRHLADTTICNILLFIMCLLSATSHFMMVKTLQVAEASVIQPFSYLQLVFGSIIGVTIFSERIDLMIIVGSLIVIGSGLFTTWREYKLKDKI